MLFCVHWKKLRNKIKPSFIRTVLPTLLNFLIMKKLIFLSTALFWGFAAFAADEPDQAGDNLDLQGVLELFEKSSSVEDFENRLNAENNDVNNLDLNEDGYVDYIRVIDYSDENVHSLTLQVPYSDDEAQDVAVILLENQGNENTVVQIIGDEDLYGDDYIVEPGGEDEKEVVNVYHWPAVRFVYAPGYRPWVSPWRYRHYPAWYKPWKPVPWITYRARPHHYHVPCRVVHVRRCTVAHAHYHKHRAYSVHYHTNHPHHTKAPNHAPGKTPKSPKKSSGKQKSVKAQPSTNPASRSVESKPTKRPGGNTRSSGGGGKGGGKKH